MRIDFKDKKNNNKSRLNNMFAKFSSQIDHKTLYFIVTQILKYKFFKAESINNRRIKNSIKLILCGRALRLLSLNIVNNFAQD